MREWTEKHIRELVRDEQAKGGGSAVAEALLLRAWLFDVNRGPVRTSSGGTITITPVQATNDGSLLAIGVMLVRVDFENCNWKGDYFIGPPLSNFPFPSHRTRLTPGVSGRASSAHCSTGRAGRRTFG